jgi:4-hydroxy-3-methylbut-2-enyl diphosphate reductase
LSDCATVGVTAGASAPEILVEQVIGRLQEWGGTQAQQIAGCPEHVVFPLPKELQVERFRHRLALANQSALLNALNNTT